MELLASLVRKGNYFSNHLMTFYCDREANVVRSGERPAAVKVHRLRRKTDVTPAMESLSVSVGIASRLRIGKSRYRCSILDKGKIIFPLQCPNHIRGPLHGTGTLFTGSKCPGREATIHLHLVGTLRMCRANHHSPHTSFWPAV
jgi:hypothetical protein